MRDTIEGIAFVLFLLLALAAGNPPAPEVCPSEYVCVSGQTQ